MAVSTDYKGSIGAITGTSSKAGATTPQHVLLVDVDGNAALDAGNTSLTSLNTVLGTTTDAAVAGDNTGTIKAALRYLAKVYADIWDSVNHRIKVNVENASLAVTQSGAWSTSVATSGGWTPGRVISAATTNATSVKASAGQLGFLVLININASVRYIKLYDKASAPTVGTDVPVQTYAIPGNAAGAGFSINFGSGIAFTLGIALALTTGVADADTGAVGANDILLNYGYK